MRFIGRRRTKNGRIRVRRPEKPPLPALELPEDAAGEAGRMILLCGDGAREGRALVENCRAILSMTEDEVRLMLPRGAAILRGEGLRLCDVRTGGLCVAGRIREIHLSEKSHV